MPAPESRTAPTAGKEESYKSPNKPAIPLLPSLILAVFIIPFVIAVLVPLCLFKGIVILLARRYRKDLKDLLTGYDSIFAVDEYYTKPYAANVTLFNVEGNIDTETLRDGFKRHVLDITGSGDQYKYLRLRQVPVIFGGYFFWKDVTVDITRHIRKIHDFRLSEHYTDDINSHEDELQRIIGDLMTAPLPNESALWEILLLNGYKGNQSILVFRLHHTLGDGYTFNHLVDQMMQKDSPYMVKPARKRTLEDKASLVMRTPQLLATLYDDGLKHRDYFTRRKQSSTGVMSMTTIPLKAMKIIRRATNTHFATVGMCLMTGAIRRYFMDNRKIDQLPNFVSIMHSLPKPNHPLSGSMCNHWGVGLFKMPLKAVTSALDRLYKSEKSFGEYMQTQFEHLLHNHMPLFRLFPYPILKIFFSLNFGTGMGFTSIPAYEKEADVFGHRVIGLWKVFGLQWRQSAVAAAAYTHNGKVGYTIYANRDIFPDQKSIDLVTKHYLHLELQELLSHFPDESYSSSNRSAKEIENMGLGVRNGNGTIRTEGFA